VVDDGSTDNTVKVMGEYIAKDSRFQYQHRPKNRLPGGNAARNYGFEVSKGEYIQWFDDDDLMDGNFIECKIQSFTAEVSVVICGGWYFFKNGNNKKIDIIVGNNLYKEYVQWKTNVFTPSILFSRDFLSTQLLFNETILKGQESEFFSRLFFNIEPKQYKIINIPLFFYRRHEETKSEFDKKYNHSFKYSTARNHIANLERAIYNKDKELINYFYKKTLKIYYSAFKNDDKNTGFYILNKFKDLLKSNNKIHYFKIKYFVKLGKINESLNCKLFKHLKHNIPKI